MPTLNLRRVVNNPKFAQSFTIKRYSILRDPDGDTEVVTSIAAYGPIFPASATELNQVPEADRVTGAITIGSTTEIRTTNPNGTADTVVWKGQEYRVAKILDYSDEGFYWAVAVRDSGR